MPSVIVACPRGLEEVLQQEILQHTKISADIKKGFVALQAGWEDIYRINLHSRTASRVLYKLIDGEVKTEADIYQLAMQVDWTQWFSVDKTIKVRIEGKASWAKRLDFMALKIKDAVCDYFVAHGKQRPNVDKTNPDIRISAYIENNQAIIYLDTSGEALFKRGWREETGEAPLRENLAAGLLLLAAYDGNQAFLDPMCGSGTIAIEAAWIAANIAPGLYRTFSFQKLNNYDAALWQKIRNEAKAHIKPNPYPIAASDAQPYLIQKAINNSVRAHVDHIIQFNCIPFTQIKARQQNGLLLCNPPYGHRLDDIEKIQQQYPYWSQVLKQQFGSWTAGFITSDLSFYKLLRLRPKRKIPLFNGQIECRLFLFNIVSGSNRK